MELTTASAKAAKLFCIESFDVNDSVGVTVWVLRKEESVRQYCRQVGMEVREGLTRMERDEWFNP